jgi:PAS domain S-box-containing protein
LYFDVIGKNPVEAWPHIGEEVNDEYKKVFETKQIHIKEDWTHINDNDIDIFTEARKIPIIKSGKVFQIITIVRDFSDRKKAEQKLKESEEIFRNFTEQSLMGVAIIQDNVVKYASKRLADIYGYSVGEMLNFEPNGFLKLIDPEFLEIVKEQATKKQLGQKGTITHYEVKCVKKTGEKFWVENYSKTINYKGKPADFVTNIEITERKKTEQLLIESEEKYRMLFEGANDAIFLLERYSVIDTNDYMLKMFGYDDKKDLIGLSPWDFSPQNQPDGKNSNERAIELIEKCLNGEAQRIYWKHSRKSGTPFDAELSLNRIFIENKYYIQAIVRDITETKLAVQKLKESEEKFRTITEQSLMGVIIIQDGRVIYVNEAESSIMEYTIQELMEWSQEDLFKHIHPDDIAKAINRSREKQQGQEVPPFFSYRIVTKSGKAKNVEINTQEIEFNEKPATLTYVLDVTEKKEAEQKYESLINNLTDIVLELDMKGIVSYSNHQCYDILGYQPSEIIGKSAFNFIYPEDISIIAEKMKEAFSTKKLVSVLQYRLVHKNRDIIHTSAMGKYVNVGGNEKFIVTIRDITFQKKIEQELKLSEEKYRLLFDNTPVGIGLSTIDGRVLDSNEAITKLTGFSAEDLNKIGASSIYADQNQRSEILKLLKKSGKLRDYEVTLRRKDNTEFLGSVSFDLLDLRGEKIIQTSLRDITKSKEAELELIKLSNLKSELLRRTSHELKTPLVSIKGFTDLLLDLHREKLDDYVVSNLNQIRKGCIRLEYLISDILNAAELESDTIQARKSEEDLSFLIKFCVKELKGLSELRKQIIKIEILEPLVILIEKEEIHKVISNILSNAIKYTPPYGTIKIRSEIQDDFIVISVKDNGIGFTEEEKSRIFKQFGKIERYGQGMDIISEGSGLGLYISKKIIELHGGKIWVESEGSKKGSTFYFSLPLIEKF